MEKELIRNTVLEYLSLRPTGAFDIYQITRMINMRGMLDLTLKDQDVEEALTFLEGMAFVKVIRGGLGASKNFMVTTQGILFYERGE